MRCVIFDIDGTLFDTKEGIISALNDTIGTFGGEQIDSDEADKYIGPPVFDSFINYQCYSDEKAREATQHYRRVYVDKYLQGASMYEGGMSVLEKMKQSGDIICIATMKTWPQVEKLLTFSGVNEFFDVIKCATEDSSLTKTKMLEQIKDEITADEYIMIGDTYGDYKAAVSNGMGFVFAVYGYGECAEAAKRVHNICEIVEFI